jgi:2-amino-4-hydroxy-6-hydroxymethyldihydropteridine diphosphokinase
VDYVLGLGSNLGSRAQNLAAGLELLDATEGYRVARVSPVYQSEPVGPPQPRYLNAAARVQSAHPPRALLARLHAIEGLLGRTRAQRWTARTLDLDILWGPQPVHEDALTIPHAQLCERWFALRPMLDVAPELADDYAARLHLLQPEPIAACTSTPEAQLEQRDGKLVVTGCATDPADALATALGALGGHLWRGDRLQAHVETHRVVANSSPGQELAAFSNAVLDEIERGHRFARVTLDALEPGRIVGRLLTNPRTNPGAAHAPLPALRLASVDFQCGALRLVLRR